MENLTMNFLEAEELVQWCIERYNYLKQTEGLTHKKLADLANMPLGTIDRLLAGKYLDFKYSTIRPVVSVLLGMHEPLPEPDGSPDQAEAFYTELEGFRMILDAKTQTIDALQEKYKTAELAYVKLEKDSHAKVDYLKTDIKRKNKIIAVLAIALAVFLLAAIVLLIIDKNSPGIGWLRTTVSTPPFTRTFNPFGL